MKKNIVLIASMLLLVGCAESIALLGGASNGKIMQSSLKTGLSLGIKKQTGSSPIEHVLTLAKRTDQKICDTLDKKKPKSCNTITDKIISTDKVIKEKKQSARELALALQFKIKEKSKIKYLD